MDKMKKIKISYGGTYLINSSNDNKLKKLESIKFYDEISNDTMFLLTTSGFLRFRGDEFVWSNLKNFTDMITSFNVNIIKINTTEWGQDIIKYIEHNNGSNIIHIFCREPIFISTFEESVKKIIDKNINTEVNYNFNYFRNSNSNSYNLGKGGNFIALPEAVYGSFFYEEGYNDEIIKKQIIKLDENKENIYDLEHSKFLSLLVYLPDYNIDNYYGTDVHHIDEILTLIPYGPNKNDYNIWFYNPVCSEDRLYQTKLKEIQQYNLLILLGFFPKEKIKLFKLYFNPEGKIIKPPIFNRVILRRENKFKIIFPEPFDDEIKELVQYEMENYIQKYEHIEYNFIDTSELHDYYGNIHCGFKSFPKLL
tara:strand:- start:661 stop:1755 length:1095 start_codon:yes stop_codon:yes gene_type:complete